MQNTNRRKAGRPIEKENRAKIGLSIDGKAKEILDYMAEKSGKTKSKIFEEAIRLYEKQEDITAQRLEMIEKLGDGAFLDIEKVIENRKKAEEKEYVEVENVG